MNLIWILKQEHLLYMKNLRNFTDFPIQILNNLVLIM